MGNRGLLVISIPDSPFPIPDHLTLHCDVYVNTKTQLALQSKLVFFRLDPGTAKLAAAGGEAVCASRAGDTCLN